METKKTITSDSRKVQKMQSVVHLLDDETVGNGMFKRKTLVVIILILVVGVLSGFGLANSNAGGKIGEGNKKVINGEVQEAGIKDGSEFTDKAEGVLEVNDGSITPEGTHQLVREGGPTQTVFLTSSVVDLSFFVGKKVRVSGETFSGQTAGWFMDVGWIQMVD